MTTTAVALSLASRSRILANSVQAWDLQRFSESKERLMDRGLRFDFEDRLILEDIPRLRRSKGGVYFFGSSTMKWATRLWELPPDLRDRIANYGIGATNHEMQFQFIRLLVEHEGFLDAGPEKVHVVLGLYWSMALDWNPEGFFAPLWRRHGLYTYDRSIGIQPNDGNEIVRTYLRERGRCSGFLGGMFNRAARFIATSAGIPLSETENIRDPAQVSAWAKRLAGTDDRQGTLTRQMSQLADLVAYLRDRGVGVSIVLLPQRRAFDALALPDAYHKAIVEFCENRHLHLVDLSHLLNEDEFADMDHSNDAGLMKSHRMLMILAMDRLGEMDLLPAGTGMGMARQSGAQDARSSGAPR
jgi:hypothetical protein